MSSNQVVSTHSDEYWQERLARKDRALARWKRRLEEKNREQGERERFIRNNADSWANANARAEVKRKPYVLNTNDELQAYAAGVAAAFTIFLGRGVTDEEFEKTIKADDIGIAQHLTLSGLDDYGVLKLLPLTPAGLDEWGLNADITISEDLKRHFENI